MTRSPCVSQAPTPSSSSFTITASAISFSFHQRCQIKAQFEHRARKKCFVEVSTPGSSAISFKQQEHVSTLHHCNHYHFYFLWLNVFYSHDLTWWQFPLCCTFINLHFMNLDGTLEWVWVAPRVHSCLSSVRLDWIHWARSWLDYKWDLKIRSNEAKEISHHEWRLVNWSLPRDR